MYHRYMPLPRFSRLPEAKRAAILTVAARHFATDGPETASYNAILAEAGISKASAYQYFDSRADLLEAVLHEVAGDLLGVLGVWRPSRDAADFAEQWRAGATRLAEALRGDEVLLALAPHCLARGVSGEGPRVWMTALIADGQRIGVVRDDLDTGLLIDVSLAVLTEIDRWALGELAAGREPDPDAAYALLDSLWRKGA
ncbi:TetR family transcriptional regulator [Enemella evansiae]|nr:TetR family transcriptional regulator [Enemella evansiae]